MSGSGTPGAIEPAGPDDPSEQQAVLYLRTMGAAELSYSACTGDRTAGFAASIDGPYADPGSSA